MRKITTLLFLFFAFTVVIPQSDAKEVPTPKLIAVKHHGDWCGSCKQMQQIWFMTLGSRSIQNTAKKQQSLSYLQPYAINTSTNIGTINLQFLKPLTKKHITKPTSKLSMKFLLKI